MLHQYTIGCLAKIRYIHVTLDNVLYTLDVGPPLMMTLHFSFDDDET
jgi:hypothetical protein